MTRIQANMFLLLAGAIWGAGFVAQSEAMNHIGPLWFIAFRFAIASITVAPLALLERNRATASISKRHMAGFTAIGLALFLGMVTQQIGLLTTSVTNSGFLTGLYVVIVPILSVVLLRRKPHRIIWPASSMALAGIFLLSGGEIAKLTTGDWLTILCAVFWSLQVLLIGVFASDSARPAALSLWQFAVTAILAAASAIVLEPISLQAVEGAAWEIFYAGVFSSGIAFYFQVVGQRYTTSAQAAIFLSSEALFAALFGATLLGEVIPSIGYVGCAMIFTAMLLVELVPEIVNRQHRKTVPN